MTDNYEEILDPNGFGVQNDGEPAKSEAVAAEPEADATPATDAAATEDAPASEPTEEKAEGEEAHDETDRKKRSGVQRLKMKLEREQAEKAALASRLAELESANKPQVAPAAEGEPNPDDFESYQAYSKALARFEAKQIIAEERRIEADRKRHAEMQDMQKTWAAKEADAATKHEDYDEVADVQALHRAGYLNPVIAEAVFTSEIGPDLLYWIGSHPEEAKRLVGLAPSQAVRELGRIEERLASNAKPTPTPKTKTSAAPPPISPVVAKGSAPAPSKFDRFEEF